MNQMDLEILGAQGFFVGRREVDCCSKEEIIDSALDEEIPIDKFSFLSFKDRETIRLIREGKKEETQFTFFWATESPFSQWHKSSFISSMLFYQGITQPQREYLEDSLPLKELEFTSAEQFMMYHKAIIFLDRATAEDIMNSSNTRKIKELGRQVKNYDDDIWTYYRSNVVYMANYLKFSQNTELMSALVETMGTTLVEAAPTDKIWGIGLTEDDPRAQTRRTWQGKNLLGEILTLLRMEFTGMY